jgi:uncharacterized OB-fold protein
VDDIIEKFLDYLSNGDFRVPICDKCRTQIWPPSNICSNCFSKKIRMSRLDLKGRLIEYSRSFIGDRKNLGLVEISGIRIIGSLSQGNMSPGSPVKLTKCGLDKDNSPYYEFSFL